jgi:hypothetical protein
MKNFLKKMGGAAEGCGVEQPHRTPYPAPMQILYMISYHIIYDIISYHMIMGYIIVLRSYLDFE